MKLKGLLVLGMLCLLVAGASGAMWEARYGQSMVTLPDGNVVLTGGNRPDGGGSANDVWKSTDSGSTWSLLTASAGWNKRKHHTSVAMPDGSIVLMGGQSSTGYENDTWRSTDEGITWALMNVSSGWQPRASFSSVALTDGSIILMGGDISGTFSNDTWRSTDNGAHWEQMSASSGWEERYGLCGISLTSDFIIVMGGADIGGTIAYNDTWMSIDNGATWTETTVSSGWTKRTLHSCVSLPDDSIVLTGGLANNSGVFAVANDTWSSPDSGVTWSQVNASSSWVPRCGHSVVRLPDGSILLAGGNNGAGSGLNDVWRSFDGGATWSEPPWPAGEVVFSGNVNDAETTLPIAGATVVITQGANTSTTTTGANGFYNSSIAIFLTGSSIEFNVNAAGYSQYNVVLVPLFSKVVALNFTLNSTTPTYTGLGLGGVARDGLLTGNVITKGYGRPIENALVYLVNNTNYEIHTKTTSMTGWYLCDEGSSCYLTSTRPYSIWGNKTGYRDSPEYNASVTA